MGEILPCLMVQSTLFNPPESPQVPWRVDAACTRLWWVHQNTASLEETRLLSFPSCRHRSLPPTSLLPRGRRTMTSWNGVFQESCCETRPPTPGIAELGKARWCQAGPSSRAELFLSKGTSSSSKAFSEHLFPNLVTRRSSRGRGTPDPALQPLARRVDWGALGTTVHQLQLPTGARLQQGRQRPAGTYQWPRQGWACAAGFRHRWSHRCSDPSRSRSDSSGGVGS